MAAQALGGLPLAQAPPRIHRQLAQQRPIREAPIGAKVAAALAGRGEGRS